MNMENKNKCMKKDRDVPIRHNFQPISDVDDKIISGMYSGNYFKRNDVPIKINAELIQKDANLKGKIAKMERNQNLSSFNLNQLQSGDENIDIAFSKQRDNIKGMLMIVRILTRSNRLTEDLVHRYMQFYQVEEEIIRTCEDQAYSGFGEYVHLIESLIQE